GGVGLVLLVDETGKVADCSVIRTSGVAALDAQACTILKLRGKLEPAIGADGKPAKGSLVGSVNWRIAG
ncbi:MAG TPA: energy transducer TonB, partial [Sphingomicrobium sp.]|nr:energy transducer TonB [Sphingomicrobium sp.]